MPLQPHVYVNTQECMHLWEEVHNIYRGTCLCASACVSTQSAFLQKEQVYGTFIQRLRTEWPPNEGSEKFSPDNVISLEIQ